MLIPNIALDTNKQLIVSLKFRCNCVLPYFLFAKSDNLKFEKQPLKKLIIK